MKNNILKERPDMLPRRGCSSELVNDYWKRRDRVESLYTGDRNSKYIDSCRGLLNELMDQLDQIEEDFEAIEEFSETLAEVSGPAYTDADRDYIRRMGKSMPDLDEVRADLHLKQHNIREAKDMLEVKLFSITWGDREPFRKYVSFLRHTNQEGKENE